MESQLKATLREILCASLSLDDGLSAIQNLSIIQEADKNLLFDIARAIEEIILRRPGLASTKLRELVVRLAFSEDRLLPEMLALLDVRYTNSYWRTETELLPDIDAIPQLLDILGELSQSITVTLRLNLWPLLPFLADETLMTLDALFARGHEFSIALALHEVHSLTSFLIEAGFFEGAELLLNRLISISKEIGRKDIEFDVALNYSCVLTELGMYEESKNNLIQLQKIAKSEKDELRHAAATLQLGVNETRDDSISHLEARKIGDQALKLFHRAVKSNKANLDDLGLAHLIIGSSILASGWREGVSESIERLEPGLEIYESIKERTVEQSLHFFKILTGLGFAYGLMSDHENMARGIEFLERAKLILKEVKNEGFDCRPDLARCENALGWLCLGTESDEYWNVGLDSFRQALEIREQLRNEGRISELELIGTKLGLALAELRIAERSDAETQEPLREILVQYVPLFPTDSRAFVEVAIATYNIVWLTLRHGGTFPRRLLGLLEDIDKMLSDVRTGEDSLFIQGASLIVPYLNASWSLLKERASHISSIQSELSNAASTMNSLAIAKTNLEAMRLEAGVRLVSPVDDKITRTDPLLAQYWMGQTALARAMKDFYINKDYVALSSDLHGAAIALSKVGGIEVAFQESVEFIKATAGSLSNVLFRFAKALGNQYNAKIEGEQYESMPERADGSQYQFILAQDWLGLMKITNAYLEMVERSENVQAQPYLNSIFSNVTRALRMMDEVAMVDRRVLSFLGNTMNRRFFLRR